MLHFLLIYLPSDIRFPVGTPWEHPYFPSKVLSNLVPFGPTLHPLTAVFGVDFPRQKVLQRCGFPIFQKLKALNLWMLSTDYCHSLVIFYASYNFMLARCLVSKLSLSARRRFRLGGAAHFLYGGSQEAEVGKISISKPHNDS